MKQVETAPLLGKDDDRLKKVVTKSEATLPTEEQAFYAAQAEGFADLRAYHASRRRRKR